MNDETRNDGAERSRNPHTSHAEGNPADGGSTAKASDPGIRITARWDHAQAPLGEQCHRGLLIEIEAPKRERPGRERPPVNVALVIDRSGSMNGAPLQAAIELAEDGDVVELLDGVFTGPGNRDLSLLGKSITVRSASGDVDIQVWYASDSGRWLALESRLENGRILRYEPAQPETRVADIGSTSR